MSLSLFSAVKTILTHHVLDCIQSDDRVSDNTNEILSPSSFISVSKTVHRACISHNVKLDLWVFQKVALLQPGSDYAETIAL